MAKAAAAREKKEARARAVAERRAAKDAAKQEQSRVRKA